MLSTAIARIVKRLIVKIYRPMLKQETTKNRAISTLHDIDVGLPVRVVELRCDPSVCQRLREMGFCEFTEVCKVTQSEALICRICNGRVALSRRLAKHIVVEPLNAPHHNEK